MSHWQWFVISLVICCGLGYIYLKRTSPAYEKNASVLIKTDTNGNTMSANAGMFQDLGLYQGNNSIQDEVCFLRSPDLMRDVVRALDLNVTYAQKGTFRNEYLYGDNLPVKVTFIDLPDDKTASFRIRLDRDGEYTISNLTAGNHEDARELKGRIGVPLRTRAGSILVTPAKAYDPKDPFDLLVGRSTVKSMASALSAGLNVKQDKDSWSIVNMKMKDSDPKRAEDVLNGLIAAYNERWIRDKRDLADNSSKFIDERINLLQQELGNVDSDISSFKSANLIPDVGEAASMYLNQASQSAEELKKLRSQEYMAKYISRYLRNPENQNKLLPANTGLSSNNVAAQISQYNTKVLDRNSLLNNTSASNPIITQYDQEISAMRHALLASIDNELAGITEEIRSTQDASGTARAHIASSPQQARYLLSVERQQKVKETLYLYLLQKREENQLNQAFTSYNTRIIRETDGSDAPVSPNAPMVMLIAFGAGLLIPALALFLKEMSVHVVRGRKDLHGMKTPFAGEIPLAGKKQRISKKVRLNNNPTPVTAVQANSRNPINEAFRVVRSNLDFMFGADGKSRVIMLTSASSGSGKTFITFNLAKSFALKDKRVICVDLDLRKASLSKYVDSPHKGVADWLAGRTDDLAALVRSVSDCPTLSILPVGTIPPNPSELLFSDRMSTLIETLRKDYDYIFLDCPPVEVVADAAIVTQYVDCTLFIVRAGILDLSMVPVIDEIYTSGKYPRMSLILNGTSLKGGRLGNSYSYGYGYGYGYGYHSYGYGDDSEK